MDSQKIIALVVEVASDFRKKLNTSAILYLAYLIKKKLHEIAIHSDGYEILSAGFPESERGEILQMFTGDLNNVPRTFTIFMLRKLLEGISVPLITIWDFQKVWKKNYWLASLWEVDPFNDRLPVQLLDDSTQLFATEKELQGKDYQIFGTLVNNTRIPSDIPEWNEDFCAYKSRQQEDPYDDLQIAEDRLGFLYQIKEVPYQRTSSVLGNFIELDCGRRLRHPYLMNLIDVVTTEECTKQKSVLLVFPNLPKLPRVPYSWDQLMSMITKLGEAVGFLHQHDIVHCDICPENLFLDGDRLVLGNFSSARYAWSRIKLVAGREAYFAPELMGGERSYFGDVDTPKLAKHNTFATDAWAYAMTCVELALGYHPFSDLQIPSEPIEFIRMKLQETSYSMSQQNFLVDILAPFFLFDPKLRPKMNFFITQERAFVPYLDKIVTEEFNFVRYTVPPKNLIERLIRLADMYQSTESMGVLLCALDFLYSSWNLFSPAESHNLPSALFWMAYVMMGSGTLDYEQYLGIQGLSNAEMFKIQERLIWGRPYGFLNCKWFDKLFTVGNSVWFYRNVILQLPTQPELFIDTATNYLGQTYRPRILHPFKYTLQQQKDYQLD